MANNKSAELEELKEYKNDLEEELETLTKSLETHERIKEFPAIYNTEKELIDQSISLDNEMIDRCKKDIDDINNKLKSLEEQDD